MPYHKEYGRIMVDKKLYYPCPICFRDSSRIEQIGLDGKARVDIINYYNPPIKNKKDQSMTLDKPKKPNLQDQWAEEQRLKREAAKPPQVNNIDNVISQPIEPKPLTPQERLTSAELAIKTLRAEQELKSVQQGYTNYLEAVKSLETERKAFEEVKTKQPAWQTRELDLNQREANILENEKIADRYCREKRIEGDKYLAEQKRLGDSYYKSSVDKTNKDIKAKNRIRMR